MLFGPLTHDSKAHHRYFYRETPCFIFRSVRLEILPWKTPDQQWIGHGYLTKKRQRMKVATSQRGNAWRRERQAKRSWHRQEGDASVTSLRGDLRYVRQPATRKKIQEENIPRAIEIHTCHASTSHSEWTQSCSRTWSSKRRPVMTSSENDVTIHWEWSKSSLLFRILWVLEQTIGEVCLDHPNN